MDNKELQRKIGDYLRQYRLNMPGAVTMQELAEDLGISTSHLGRIERGENDTTLSTFLKMAAILDIPDDFIEEMKQFYKDNKK